MIIAAGLTTIAIAGAFGFIVYKATGKKDLTYESLFEEDEPSF